MRGFWVKSRLISIACALVGLGLGACGSGSKSAPEGRKAWAFLSAQSRQIATRSVISSAAPAERSRGTAPSVAAAPERPSAPATPTKPLDAKKPGSDSPVVGASREAAFETTSPNFPPAPVAPRRPERSLQDFSGPVAAPALPAPAFSAPAAPVPAPTAAFQGSGGGAISRPTFGGGSGSSASSGSGSSFGASTPSAPSAPRAPAAPSAPAPAAAPAAPASAPTLVAAAPSGGSGSVPAPAPAAPVPPAPAKAPTADGAAKAPEPPSGGEAQGAPQGEAKSKTPAGEGASGEPPSAPKSDGAGSTYGEGQLQSSSQAVVYAANTSGGLLGSQPPTYTMESGTLMPSLFLAFEDDNEDLKKWTYTKDAGQEFFPAGAVVRETFFSKEEGGLCAPDPKGCEGRVLRWFDLGPLPVAYKESGPYLYDLRMGRLKPENNPKKATYVDVGIGAGNQIKMPQIPAKTGHVIYVLLIPEGAPIAVAPVEMNLEDPGEYEQFLKVAMNKEYRFARGIWVRPPMGYLDPYQPIDLIRLNEPAKLRVLPGGSK